MGQSVTYSDLPEGATVFSDLPEGAQIVPAAPPSMSAAPAKSTKDILADFETDLRSGGGRTAVGRLMGQLQGRGDKGFSGLQSGVSPGVANFMGSPELGVTHAVQGAQQIPEHPMSGMGKTLLGILEAGTIPGMVVGGPAATTAINAVPSAAHAGAVLEDIGQAAKHVPVPVSAAAPHLQRIQELANTGSVMPRAADLLANRSTWTQPIEYPEARDFYSNISRLSADEYNKLTPVMQRAMGSLRAGLHNDLTNAAATVGRGEDYAGAIKEYAQASTLAKSAKTIGKTALAGALGAAAYGKAKTLIGALSGR